MEGDTSGLLPDEVARLLGVPVTDVAGYRPGIWRVSPDLVSARRTNGATADLSIPDVCGWFGLCRRTVQTYLGQRSVPRLPFRTVVDGGRRKKMIAPAHVFAFFRERNRLAGGAIEIRETPGQRSRRVSDTQARVAAMLGD